MPITYESAAPVGAFADIAQQLARTRALAASQNAYAQGGYGVGHSGVTDTGDQQALFVRNNESFQREADSLNRTGTTNQSLGQAQWASQQQADHFRLQAELQQTELTQAEQMRLTRMKNAVGEVSSDPTLADDEKAAIVTKLRTGIDPMEHRLAKVKIQAEAQAKQMQAEQFQAHAAFEQQRLKTMGMSAEDRDVFLPDAQALAEITADLTDSMKGNAFARMIPPELIGKMAKQEAMRQGLGRRVFIQPDGKIDHHPDKPGAGEKGPQTPVFDPLKASVEADKLAEQDQRRKKKNALGEETFENPQDAQWRENRSSEVFNLLQKRFQDHARDTAAAFPKQGASGYDPSKASWRKGKGGVASDATNPTDASAPVTKPIPPAVLGGIPLAAQRLDRSGLPPEKKAQARFMLDRLAEIAKAHPGGLPADLEAEVKNLQAKYKEATTGMRDALPPGPTPGGIPDPSNWADQ